MKIGLVCPYNIFKGGGVQECVLALQEGLTARGHEAKIITPQPRGYKSERVEGSIILVGGATGVRSFHTTAQVSVSVDIEALENMLEKEQFDVLHFHEPWVPILSRQILSRSKCRNVATFHAKLPETMLARIIERIITPYTRGVLGNLSELTAVSNASSDYLQSLTTRPVEIIPNGIDLKKYKKSQDPSPEFKGRRKKTILYIGRLEKRKGVIHLIKAFVLLRETHKDVELIIAGAGPYRRKLEEYARLHEIPDVRCLGHIDEATKLGLLARADLFCSPALYGESFGIVLLEAIACGLPLVAGNNPGYSSVMKDRGAISLVDPTNHDGFAKRLQLLLDDNDVRELWKNWAREYIQRFDYVKLIDRYEEVYKRAIKS